MTMKIIRPSQIIEPDRVYAREFSFANGGGGGWSFQCDKYVNIKVLDNPEAIANYAACLAGIDRFDRGAIVDKGIVSWEPVPYRQPAIGECECCGEEVYLSNFTNTCDCGADYNSSGDRLAHRSQWGEETGEHWSECY